MDKIKEFFIGNRTPAYTDKLPTKLLLGCRAIVGGYLAYTVYGLMESYMNPEITEDKTYLIVFSVIFSIAAFILLYMSARDFMIGRYMGGSLDLGERPEGEETEEEVVEEAEEEAVVDAISGIEEEDDPERIDGDVEE